MTRNGVTTLDMNRIMAEISEEKYNTIKNEALAIFRTNKKIHCPSLGGIEVKLTPRGFNHLEWRKENHRRSTMDAYMRYLCFKHVKYILNNSRLYQEHKEELDELTIRRKGVKVRERRLVEYFGFVAIVNGNKNRVKVVICKTSGFANYEFVSVVPYWSMDGYARLYFEERENHGTKKEVGPVACMHSSPRNRDEPPKPLEYSM